MAWTFEGLHLLSGTFYNGTGNKRRFAEQINALIMSERGNKVIDGCLPTVGGQTDLSLAGNHLNIASGNILIDGIKFAFAGGNVDLSTAQATLIATESMFVLITIYDNASTATLRATSGAIAADGSQEPPDYPEDEAGVCLIYLNFSDTTMDSSQIGEWRFENPANGYFSGGLDIAGHDGSSDGLSLGGTLVTATAAEINLLDGKAFGIADNNIVEIDSASVLNGEYAKFTANGLESQDATEMLTFLGITYGIANTNIMKAENTPVDDDYAKFTANGLEGRSYSEVRTDLGVVVGVNVLAQQTIGIADDNLVEVDGTVENNDYAKWTANGLLGRTYAEVRTDLALIIGTNVLAQRTLSSEVTKLSNTSIVVIDSTSVTNAEYARFTANGLESRSVAEMLGDIDAAPASHSHTDNTISDDIGAGGATLAQLADLLMFGSSNAEWVPCIFEGTNTSSVAKVNNGQVVSAGTNGELGFKLTTPSKKGTLSFTATDVLVVLSLADGSSYIDDTYVYFLDNSGHTEKFHGSTNRDSAGSYSDSFTPFTLSDAETIGVKLQMVAVNAGLEVTGVFIKGYYS